MNPLARLQNAAMSFFMRRIGHLLARHGMPSGAAWYFREAHANSPGDAAGLFDLARASWLAGDVAAAKKSLLQLIEHSPDHVKALNLLGVIAKTDSRLDEAEGYFNQAIALSPGWAAPHNNLGSVFLERDDFGEAERYFRRALECDAGYVESLSNLALLLNRGGRYEEAEQLCRKAVRLKPDFAGAINNLGSILLNLGRFADGVGQYREALRLQPDLVEAQINLAVSLSEPALLAGVSGYFEKILERNPDSYIALIRLAQAKTALLELDEAEDLARRALALHPLVIDAHNLLGNILAYQANGIGAANSYHRALELGGNLATRSSYLFNILYDPAFTAQRIYQEAREYGRIFDERFGHLVMDPGQFSNDRDEGRKLRIGYISRDFCRHSVSFFLEPILTWHDQQHFEVYCYANLLHPDAVTDRYKRLGHGWRDIALVNDDDLARMVHEDRIDILVDLSGHTTGNRLFAVARRMAPVQIHYLAFAATTGVSTIDYRIVDAITDPPGEADKFHSEQLLRLPGCFLTYLPESEAPVVVAPPCMKVDHVTFGTFNNPSKVNEQVAAVWSRILHRIPGSHLMLKHHSFRSARVKQRYIDMFASHDVEGERLEFLSWQEVASHLESYSALDIGLDPFPYNGTTTTCETLWMGVPVVTLRGQRHSARVGASLLSQLGMPEFICDSEEDYVEIAVALAEDPSRLAALRASLRQRIQASPLLDHAGFTRELETAYREVWSQTVKRLKKEKHPEVVS